MTALAVVFGIALLLAVLVSAVADRGPLSTTVVFLAVGLVAGPAALDVVDTTAKGVETAVEIALFVVLFIDGQHAPLAVLRQHRRTAARALVVATPLTFLLVAVSAHYLLGLAWVGAAVLGALLAPTDPVFASALVGRDEVPTEVRRTLNIESGLNDGLSLPAVLLLVGLAGGDPDGWTTEPWALLLEVVLGGLIGVLLPLAVVLLLRIPGVGAVERLQPLGPLSVALVLWGLCDLLTANQFIAAFAAGATVATVRPSASESFRPTGELLSELVKGAALLAFATLLDPAIFATAGIAGVLFAVVVVPLTRPLAMWPATLGARDLVTHERLALSWFGPKGFATVAYAVIVLLSEMDDAEQVFALATVSVLVSVMAHSTLDVPLSARLRKEEEERRGVDR
jgi:NhaP-type Na+/H+ or K+/H+ antiporter